MRIEILDDLMDDLVDGFHFYEEQSPGLGSYSLDSVFADIDSLLLYAGIHRSVFGSHRYLASRFLLRFTIASKPMSSACVQSSTVAEIPPGSGVGSSAPSAYCPAANHSRCPRLCSDHPAGPSRARRVRVGRSLASGRETFVWLSVRMAARSA